MPEMVLLVARICLVLLAVNPFERAEDLREAGRLRDALLLYQEAQATLPDPTFAYRNAAMIELALGDPGLARADYERYLALAPQADDAEQVRAVLAELGRVHAHLRFASCSAADHLFEEGQMTRARAAYAACLPGHESDATLWRRFARTLMRAGDRTGALEAYRHYLRLSPNAPDALFVQAILGNARD
jgi:tetratricopeptide (TPR) repeat protein